jgi:sialic acid synthase SpsE
VARRSLVAARALPAGHRLTRGDVAIKRPGTGLTPADLEVVVGRTLARAVDADELLDWSALRP